MAADVASFFTEYGENNRYTILEVIGKGSYGVVCSAVDNTTGERAQCAQRCSHVRYAQHSRVPEYGRAGERVAIKKINDVFEHVSVRDSRGAQCTDSRNWRGQSAKLA